MGSKVIGTRIILDGEKEYRQAINECKNSMGVLRSELDLVTTQYSKNANSLTALESKQELFAKMQDEQRKKVAAIQDIQQKAIKKYEQEAERLDELGKARDKDAKALEKAKEKYGENSEEVSKLAKELEKSTSNYENQKKALSTLENKISRYTKELNNASTELLKLDSETAKNRKYIDEAKISFRNCATSIDQYGNSVEKSSGKVKEFSSFVTKSVAADLMTEGIKKVAVEMIELGERAIEVGSNFEESMSIVSATMNISANDIRNGTGDYKILEDAARQCGATTKYSATEAGDALNYLALAGYDATQAADALPAVLNLAAAGAMDLAYSSDLVTDSMSSLGIESEKLVNFTDQMAVTSQKSNTNIAQLGEAILTIGGTAKQLAGGTIELNTELGILADNGIKGAEGGTALRNILKDLTAPTDKAAIAMKDYNLQVYDMNGNMRPLNETFRDLGKILDGMNDQKRAEVMNTLFDARNLKSAEALIANCGERFNELSGYIANCDGATKNMASTMSDNLKGKTKELQSSLEELGISLYTRFEQPLKTTVKTATSSVSELNTQLGSGKLGKSVDNLATSFENLSGNLLELGVDALPSLIDATTWMIDNGGTLISVVSGLVTTKVAYGKALKAATLAQQYFNITANLNPYVLLATAIAGVTTAVVSYKLAAGDSAKQTDETTKKIVSYTEQLEVSRDTLHSLKEDTQAHAQYVSELKTELIRLNEAQTGDENEKKRIAELVKILNEQIPGLNLQINEQTGYINESSDAIEKNIDNLLAWYSVQSMQEKIEDTYKQTADASYELWKAETDLKDIQTELNQIGAERVNVERQYAKAAKEGGTAAMGYSQRLLDLDSREEALRSKQKDLTQSVSGYKKELKSTESEIKSFQDYIDAQKASMDDNTRAAFENAQAQRAAGEAAEDAAGQAQSAGVVWDETYQKMVEDLEKAVESQMNLFEEFKEGTEVSKEKLLANMQSQVDGINSWVENLESIAGRTDVAINQGFLMYLAEMGPTGAAYVKAFAEMNTQELQKAMDSFVEAAMLPTDATVRIMNSYSAIGETTQKAVKTGLEASEEGIREQTKRVSSKAIQTGLEASEEGIRSQTKRIAEQVGAGYKEGLKESTDKLESGTKEAVEKGIIKTSEKTLQINSPSKVTKKHGAYVGDGYVVGIRSKSGSVKLATTALANTIISTSKSLLKTETFYDIGTNITESLAKGIKDGRPHVVAAMRSISQSVSDTSNNIKTQPQSTAHTVQSGDLKTAQAWRGASDDIVAAVNRTMNTPGMVRSEIAISQKSEFDTRALESAIASAVSKGLSQIDVNLKSDFDQNSFIRWSADVNSRNRTRTGGRHV